MCGGSALVRGGAITRASKPGPSPQSSRSASPSVRHCASRTFAFGVLPRPALKVKLTGARSVKRYGNVTITRRAERRGELSGSCHVKTRFAGANRLPCVVASRLPPSGNTPRGSGREKRTSCQPSAAGVTRTVPEPAAAPACDAKAIPSSRIAPQRAANLTRHSFMLLNRSCPRQAQRAL